MDKSLVDTKSSLDRLAHIANITHELHELNRQIKEEKTPESDNSKYHDAKFKARRLACTWCRQQKSRCDAQERDPLPCTRCEKKGLQCEMKADFKRTEKRARIALIEKEFAELKKSFMGPIAAVDILKSAPTLSIEGTPQIRSPVISRPSPLNSRSDSPVVETMRIEKTASPKLMVPEMALLCEEKTLDTVVLEPNAIRLLYLEFVRSYHPVLNVVDVSKGPERIYRLCPALFWVMMFVALRRFGDDTSLLLRLLPLIKNILSEITISPITRYNPTEEDEPIMNACSVYSVQAFILYTLWPPLTSSLSADSSWNTIGVALFQAIRIGLHSAGQIFDPDPKQISPPQYSMAQEQMKTWIVCNIVAQNIATSFGFPAFVQFDFLRVQHVEISVSTRHVMEIAHFEDQVAKTLNFSSGTLAQVTERLALLKVLLRQLDELEIKITSESSDEDGYRKLQYIVARVHLLTHYFLDAPSIPSFELSKGLVRLYNAAISLVSHLEMCQAKNKDFVKHLPVVSILNIWQASCIIVKLANSPLKAMIDVNAGKHTYLSAISLVAKASILKHDIAYRASGIMRNMWQLFRTLDEKNMTSLTINTRSRMAASVFFDCLALLRDQVGMAKLNIRTDVNNDDNEDEDEDGLYEGNNDFDEGVVSSDEEVNGEQESSHVSEQKEGKSDSTSQKSGSSSSSNKVRKKRALSNLMDAESKARRIIRTIPLDPQPISASKRSSIFKVVNTSNDTSPSVKTEDTYSHGSASPGSIPVHRSDPGMPPPKIRPSGFSGYRQSVPVQQIAAAPVQEPSRQFPEVFMGFQESPTQAPGNLEHDVFDVNSDLLWKDVDSLMNDFGFHT